MLKKTEDILKYCKNLDEIKGVKPEELGIWPIHKGHWFKFVKLEDKWEMIDLELVGLIKALNDAGLKTKFCCAGHINDSTRGGWCIGSYISFEATDRTKELIGRTCQSLLDYDSNHSFRVEVERFNSNTHTIRFHYKAGKRAKVLSKIEETILNNLKYV